MTTDPPGKEHTSITDALEPDVTEVLHAWSDGDEAALDELIPLVFDELHKIARHYLNRESGGHTLQPTALVNELYLRLQDRRQVQWKNRLQFFGFSASMMRRILVDHARGHNAAKRGSGARKIYLDEALDVAEKRHIDLVRLDDALDDLSRFDARQSRIVELRFFAGLSIEEVSTLLELSPTTIKREWKVAKMWLRRELKQD